MDALIKSTKLQEDFANGRTRAEQEIQNKLKGRFGNGIEEESELVYKTLGSYGIKKTPDGSFFVSKSGVKVSGLFPTLDKAKDYLESIK